MRGSGQTVSGFSGKALEWTATGSRALFREADSGFAESRVFELAYSFLGALVLVCGFLIALLPAEPIHIAGLDSAFLSGGALVATGLSLYAFGTRGFRRQVIVDAQSKTITFGRINSKNTCRISTVLPFSEIQSIYVGRLNGADGEAALMLRRHGKQEPFKLLTGREDHLRKAHAEISQVANAPSRRTAGQFNDFDSERAKSKVVSGVLAKAA